MSDQAIRVLDGALANQAFTDTSAGTTLPGSADHQKYLFSATAPVYIKTGVGAQTATTSNGIFLGGNQWIVLEIPSGHTHFAAIQNSIAGVLSVQAVD